MKNITIENLTDEDIKDFEKEMDGWEAHITFLRKQMKEARAVVRLLEKNEIQFHLKIGDTNSFYEQLKYLKKIHRNISRTLR